MTTTVARDLNRMLLEIKLPEGIRWLTDELQLQAAPSGGYSTAFKAWLAHFVPPTGPNGEGSKLYVHPLRFGFLTASSCRGEAKDAVLGRVESAIKAFQKALADGTAIEVKDLDPLP